MGSLEGSADFRKGLNLGSIGQGLRAMSDEEFLAWRQMSIQEANRRSVGELMISVKRTVEDVFVPFSVVPLGDLHAGSGATNWEQVAERVDGILKTPGVYVIGTGDLIESVDPEHGVDSLQNSLSLTDQFELIRSWVIAPLVNDGRFLAMVRGHRAHEGALVKSVGDDPWRRMVQGFDVPLVANGGVVELILSDGFIEKSMKFQSFHNMAGRSGNNPIRSLEKMARGYSPGNVPDVIFGAHDHRAAAAVEMGTVLVRGGSPKGNRDNPDPFGISLGFAGTDPAGQGVLAWVDGNNRGKDFEVVPYMDKNLGLVTLAAMRIWDGLERQGISEEVVEEIQDRNGEMTLRINRKDSVTAISDEWGLGKRRRKEPQQKIEWNVKTCLPVGLFVLANMRLGSRTHDEGQDVWVEEMLRRDNMLWVAGRQLVDRKVPKAADREHWVDEALCILRKGKGRNVGVLYDAVMKSEAWKKPVKEEREVVSDPILVVSEIAEEMETVILEHMGLIGMNIGRGRNKVHYSATIMDNLENRGSTAFPTGGLVSVYQGRLDQKPGIVMGGHMPGAGSAQFFDAQNSETPWPVMVAPGWMAKRANWKQSAATESPADPLGPGVVLMPGGLGLSNEYAAVPVGRKDQWVLLDALTVLAAVRLGWMGEDRLLNRKGRD